MISRRQIGGVADPPGVNDVQNAKSAESRRGQRPRPTEEGAVRSLRRPEVVDFDQTNASAVVKAREQRGVKARRQRRRYARLQWVCRRETVGHEFRGLGLVILPVVIRDQKRSITVAQLQRWIGQRVGHTKASQAGTYASRYDSVHAAVVAQDETRDHYVVTRVHKRARADITQFRAS